MIMLRRSLLAAPFVLAAAPAWAQWVPRQPIKILVGYRAGRHGRHRRPHCGRHHPAPARLHRHRRQQDRRRRLHRAEGGRPVAAGRLHGRHRHHGPARGRPGRAGLADPARPRQGAGADLQSGRRADGADRAHGRAVQDHCGTHRLRQGQPRQGELRLDRPGVDQSARRGIPGRRSGRAEDDPRAVSRRRAGHCRRGGGQCRPLLRQCVGDHEHGARRQGARAGARRRASRRRWRRNCRCSPRTFRRSTSTTGSASSGRPACRRTSRHRWPKCFSMRWQIPRMPKRSASRVSSRSGRARQRLPRTSPRTASAGRRW